MAAAPPPSLVEPEARETVEVSIKYAAALELQQRNVARVQRSVHRQLPEDLDYASMGSLSNEEVQKLSEARPRTLQEASEISGITPHAIGCLLVALRSASSDAEDAGSAERRAAEKQRRRVLVREASTTAGVAAVAAERKDSNLD